MKYFAKYLPVEGEIKVGDKTISPTGMIWSSALNDSPNIGGTLKVAKLFLCSRDIQVDDTMTVLSSSCLWGKFGEICTLIENFPKQGKCTVKAHNGTIYHAYCDIEFAVQQGTVIKVIGEISPAATWVKDGDEFDDDLVKLIRTVGCVGTEVHKTNPDYHIYASKYGYFQIKCPTCGTFH